MASSVQNISGHFLVSQTLPGTMAMKDLAVIFLALWILLLYFYSPQAIVQQIGIKNSYLLISALGFFAGLSSFLATPFYTLVGTFSGAGVGLLQLMWFGGLSLSLGHMIYFFLGLSGRSIISKEYKSKMNKITKSMNNYPRLVPLLTFAYFAFTPFPNELILVPLGLITYSFTRT